MSQLQLSALPADMPLAATPVPSRANPFNDLPEPAPAVPVSQVREHQPFNPLKVSPSRINNLSACGVAFKLNYIDGVKPQRSGSAALFGTVVHKALEKWSINRSQSLVTLMREAWISETQGTIVKDFIELYSELSVAAIQLEQEIRAVWEAKGKESKAPRRTKEWKDSSLGKQIRYLMGEWGPKLDRGSYWRFGPNDSLPALYDESLVLARRYTDRFQSLPPALHTELKVNAEWRGFLLNGFVDELELHIDPDAGELKALLVIDYKSYKKPPAEFKDWRQLVFYDIAVRHLVELGVLPLPVPLDEIELYVGIDYVRWTRDWKYPDDDPDPLRAGKPFPPRKFWKIGDADYERLFRECRAYEATVRGGHFLPAEKGRNPDFCDYPERCCLRNVRAAGGQSTPVEVVQV